MTDTCVWPRERRVQSCVLDTTARRRARDLLNGQNTARIASYRSRSGPAGSILRHVSVAIDFTVTRRRFQRVVVRDQLLAKCELVLLHCSEL